MTKRKMPTEKVLLDIAEVAGTAEAADYYEAQLERILVKEKLLGTWGETLNSVKEFARCTKNKFLSSAQIWRGESPDSGFMNMQTAEVTKSLKDITVAGTEAEEPVTFHFSISDQAELLRGYFLGDALIDEPLVAHYDVLLNAYLAGEKVVSLDGVLYECTANGEIKQDAKGNDLRANPERARELLGEGFEAYLEDKGVAIISQSQEYLGPSEEVEVQAQRSGGRGQG